MRIIRRTQITWETRRIVMTTAVSRNMSAWCTTCAAPTTWLDLLQAAACRDVPFSQVQSWLATGHLHTIPPATHPLLICLNSLLRYVEES